MRLSLRSLIVLLFCLAAVLPIVSTNALFHPQAWAQAMVFRVVVALLLVLLVGGSLASHLEAKLPKVLLERLLSAKIVLVPLALFALVMAIATLFSQDPYSSFWGTPSRGWGILNDFLLMIFALLAFLFLSSEDWKRVWGAALGTGVAVAVIAVIQAFGLLPSLFNATGLGAPGTLGSSIVLGLYLVLLAFAALALRKLPLFLFFVLAIAMTLSRSSWIGLATGLMFFLVFFPQKQVRGLAKRVRWRGLALALLVCGVLALATVNLTAPPSLANNVPLVSRAWQDLQWENIFDLSRILAWQIEFQALAEKPFLGWGPYNSQIGFNKHFDPIVTQAHARPYFDTSHNEFLDIALGAGLLGLAAYFWFIAALLWKLQNVLPETRWQARAMQAGIVGSHAALFFFPYMFATKLLAFLLVAYGFHLFSQKLPILLPHTVQLRGTKTLVSSSVLLALAGAFAFFFAIQPLLWNKTLNLAEQQTNTGRCQAALSAAKDILKQGKNSFFAYWLNLKYVEIVAPCVGYQEEKVQQVLSERAAAALKEELRFRSKEPRTWILLGGYMDNLAAFAQNSEERNSFLEQARGAFQTAERLSPRRYEIFAEWTRSELLSKNFEGAKEKAQRCIALNDVATECWLRLSFTQFQFGNVESGVHALGKARQGGTEVLLTAAGNEQLILQILRTVLSLQEKPYQEIAHLYEDLVTLHPTSPQYWASLATTYRELGKYENAKWAAMEVLKLQPENEAGLWEFFQTLPPEFRPDRFR